MYYIPTAVFPLPTCPSPSPPFIPPPFPFRQGQASQRYQPNMAYQIAITLGTFPSDEPAPFG